tara:strand:+ start:1593 stop:2144 length:552 start_codon:yes stop_codon:yes gene_type:complete
MISFDKQFIFLHPGKCGGSTIKHEFLAASRKHQFDILHTKQHKTLDFFLNLIVDRNLDPDDFFKFTIVRNPWDRAVSWYYHWHMVYQPEGEKEPFNKWLKSKGKRLSFVDFSQMDYVIKLEEIDVGMTQVFNKLEIPQQRVKHHITYGTGRPKKEYKEYYDSETKQLVHDINRDMIKKFNYTF